jgi:hypothetical protein
MVWALSACTAPNSGTGTIAGTAQPCIGPYIPHAHYVVRFVRVSAGTRTVALRKNLTTPFRFTFTVPPGTYKVSAPADGSTDVHVHRGQTARVSLRNTCMVKSLDVVYPLIFEWMLVSRSGGGLQFG